MEVNASLYVKPFVTSLALMLFIFPTRIAFKVSPVEREDVRTQKDI